MRLTFHGGAKSVTGANYLVESGQANILVDCGLIQGGYYCDKRNFEPFPYEPDKISAAFITHAHIDHTGRLPKLIKDGFKGTVYSTPPTREFAGLLLADSENILNKEAQRENHAPLYGIDDVQKLMTQWQGVSYRKPIEEKRFKITLYDAGHILGSSVVVVESEGKKIAFSGDLGNSPSPIIMPTESLEELDIDYCVIESTYGDRFHEDVDKRKGILENIIEATVKTGGVLMIPAFAMERTQQLLFELNELVENGRIPRVPIFIDSPLAIKLTAVYREYRSYFNPEVRDLIKSGDDIFNFRGLKMTLATEESKAINEVPSPKIIIAGSGMSQGGRILHHERRYLSDPKNTILFVGYQAKNSLGRKILEGAKIVKIFGEEVPVNCRVEAIGGYSAHADQAQLLNWLKPARKTLKKVFVVQGEEEASAALLRKIHDELAIEAVAPNVGDVIEI
ncbi:hypothetical protein A3A20_00520 [Candidatus Wolfebacteria bacterium RIFCSPLOWO2_01_FULL_45_19]|uniref:MBL fold hydrolase n=1 Tax=Candidatus Wolfebacteria bacterium RIFCSPLOWO2_01_FULL_45_19 TaxID=1802557 RepID=A0A1F8DTB1_9BACT|nr:MAG: hypothetical protein A3A20_00520 [Candidatus Wolfebacteria bacterium RIFCSPLOWO2_01_FULL_45_19]